jgi:hypothetical protein
MKTFRHQLLPLLCLCLLLLLSSQLGFSQTEPESPNVLEIQGANNSRIATLKAGVEIKLFMRPGTEQGMAKGKLEAITDSSLVVGAIRYPIHRIESFTVYHPMRMILGGAFALLGVILLKIFALFNNGKIGWYLDDWISFLLFFVFMWLLLAIVMGLFTWAIIFFLISRARVVMAKRTWRVVKMQSQPKK